MALIVHKYGGTSMGSTERIRSVAQRVAKWARAGHQMVVVPSAMSGETNRLLGPGQGTVARADDARDAARARHDRVDRRTGVGRAAGDRAAGQGIAGGELRRLAGADADRQAYTKARIATSTSRASAPTSRPGKVVVITGFQGIDPTGT